MPDVASKPPRPARVVVLVPAAGSGRRMGGTRKPFLALGRRTVLEEGVSRFLRRREVVQVVVAAPRGFFDEEPDEAARLEGGDARMRLVEGGASRFESVERAFAAARADADVVAVHDGARPFPPDDAIGACIACAAQGRVAVAGVPVVDTVKRADSSGRRAETVPREGLWRAQTPQMFPRPLFSAALARCRESGARPTDDSWMAEAMGESVRMIRSSSANLKITRPADLRVAECLLRSRRR